MSDAVDAFAENFDHNTPYKLCTRRVVFTASIANQLQPLTNVNVIQQYTEFSLCVIRFAINIETIFFPYTALISSPQRRQKIPMPYISVGNCY